MNAELSELRRRCPMPALMRKLGLEQFARTSCKSPFRNDQNASWGIYERNGRYWYKDFATGESGDEISLLAQVCKLDQQRDFKQLVRKYTDLASTEPALPVFEPCAKPASLVKPDTSFLRPGTDDEIRRLSALRSISVAGLERAQQQAALRFGLWHAYEVFAVLDASGCLAEIRRLDGELFPAMGTLDARKSHTLKHSSKNWPLGILKAAECGAVALVEGVPDYLALHQFILEESVVGKVAPVAMLTSSCLIHPDAIHLFKAKHVRIFPHNDAAGFNAAKRWQMQLTEAGAVVDFFNFAALEIAGHTIKDLCDFNQSRTTPGFSQQRIFANLV